MATPAPTHRVSPEPVTARKPRRRLWLWFAAGFLIVFIGMSVGVTAYYMHPTGQALVRCKLWQYYLVQIPRLFQVHNLGPASGDSDAAITMLMQHLGCSMIGGLAAVGIGWGIHQVKRRNGEAD